MIGAYLETLGAIGAMLGIFGSLLLANQKLFGWLFFLVSNLAWIAYGIITEQWSIVVMQVFFMATSLYGLYKWSRL